MKRLNLIIVIISLFLSACGSNSYLSKIPQSKMIIDGKLNDWSDDLKYIEDDKAAIGVKNDQEFLYLCYTTAERNKIMLIFTSGFTVWLKPENSKTLGFQFPVRSHDEPSGNFRTRKRSVFNSALLIKKYLKNHNEFLILNDDNFPLYGAKLSGNTGYSLGLGYQSGKFIYELKIPFKTFSDKHIPIVKIPNKKLEIVFESGELESLLLGSRSSFPGGRGGRRGGLGAAGPRGGNFNIPEKIEISIYVNLN